MLARVRNTIECFMCGLLWVAGYLLCNVLFDSAFSEWGALDVAIATDVVFIILGSGFYKNLRVEMLRLEVCDYEILPAIGHSAMVFLLWFCADIVGNVIAVTVPDPGLDDHLMTQALNPYTFMFLSVCIAPVAEEILLRGIVYVKFKAGSSVWIAAVASSMLFGIMHGTLAQFFIATLFGMGQCFLFEYTRKLRWVIGLHVLVNISNFVIAGMSIPVEYFVNIPLIVFLLLVIAISMAVIIPKDQKKIKPQDF